MCCLVISLCLRYAPSVLPLAFTLFFCLAAILLMFYRKEARIFLPLGIMVALMFISCGLAIYDYCEVSSLRGETEICGTITDVNVYKDSVSYEINAHEINGERKNVKLFVSSSGGYGFKAGDSITVTANMTKNTKNMKLGNNLILYDSVIKAKENSENLHRFFGSIRRYIKDTLFSNMPYDSASLMMGLTLGEKQYLSDSLAENIRNSGISHVIVVSGMHLAIITRFLIYDVKKTRKRRALTAPFGIALVTLFVVLTGFTPSVLRAAVTYYIMFFGMLFSRRPDAISSLFAALTVILIFDPFASGDLSFQLSAVSTFGVLVVAPVARRAFPYFEGRKGKLVSAFATVASTSLSATLMTLPFIVYRFEGISLVAMLTNLLITYPASIALTSAVFAFLFAPLPFIGRALLLVSDLSARFIIWIVNSLGGISIAMIEFSSNTALTVITFVAAAALAIYCMLRYDRIKGSDGRAHNI